MATDEYQRLDQANGEERTHDADGPRAATALFRRDGDVLLPGPFTRGPWYADALHGSAMLAVMAEAAEGHPSDVPRQVVRLTVDMVRAAPMAPLAVEVTTVRSGKSIDLLDLALVAEGEVHVRGRALRLRTADLPVAPAPGVDAGSVPSPPADAGGGSPFGERPGGELPAFHDTIDIVPVTGPAAEGERSTAWFRLNVPVVEGEPTSGFVVAATLCDWTYAVPHIARLAAEGPGEAPDEEGRPESINVDTTVSLFRPMVGGWLAIRVRSEYGDVGAGLSSGELFDERGRLGFSTQSVLVRGIRGAEVAIREV